MTRSGGGARTPLEDRVRDAIHAKAGEVPPGAVPPLRLPARRRPSFSLPHGGREREGGPAGRAQAARAWAAPLTAAAGVAAALGLVFALAGVIHPGRPANSQPPGLAALPRYYVALTFTGHGQCCEPGKYDNPRTHAVVRVTRTGRPLATIAVPRPYGTFVGVSAAADDRTFILAAEKLTRLPLIIGTQPGTKFFLLRIDPGRRDPAERARLTPLPVPDLPAGAEVSDFALSPDGARLAMLGGPWNQQRLRIYNLRTGAVRTYVPGGIGDSQAVGANQNSLSWASDGRTLAFLYWGDPGAGGVRLLDTAAPGRDLLASSRVAVPQPPGAAGAAYLIQARLTPDGQAVIANRYQPGRRFSRAGRKFSQQLLEFSARTGKVTRVLSGLTHQWGDDEQVHWMSPDGRVLLVTDAVAPRHQSRAPHADADAGLLDGGRYTPLPWSEDTFTAAW